MSTPYTKNRSRKNRENKTLKVAIFDKIYKDVYIGRSQPVFLGPFQPFLHKKTPTDVLRGGWGYLYSVLERISPKYRCRKQPAPRRRW